jgi:hypothetical protein
MDAECFETLGTAFAHVGALVRSGNAMGALGDLPGAHYFYKKALEAYWVFDGGGAGPAAGETRRHRAQTGRGRRPPRVSHRPSSLSGGPVAVAHRVRASRHSVPNKDSFHKQCARPDL